MFDWEREWYEGERPIVTDRGWRDFARDHPVECLLSSLLIIGVIAWTTIN
jgi:hypothetical protein